jgi:hypothetical protein
MSMFCGWKTHKKQFVYLFPSRTRNWDVYNFIYFRSTSLMSQIDTFNAIFYCV